MEYKLNKGVGQDVEFCGLKAQYLYLFAGGLLAVFLVFVILYMAGVNRLFCIALCVISASGITLGVFRLNRKYGPHGLMKLAAAGKYYLAVTEGVPGKQEGIFIDYLKKNGKANMSQAVPENTPGAKKAILHYRVLDQKEMNGKSRALLKIKLETGRHHQIRVQLSHAGIPLLGDRKYNPSGEKGTSLGLCSCGLEFKHPKTGKIMKFETEPQGTAFLDFVKKL